MAKKGKEKKERWEDIQIGLHPLRQGLSSVREGPSQPFPLGALLPLPAQISFPEASREGEKGR